MRLKIVLALVCLMLLSASAIVAQEAEIPNVAIDMTSMEVPAEVPAGIATFSFSNSSPEAPAMPILARLNEGVTPEAFNESLAQGPMAAIELIALLGGTMMNPGANTDITYDLKPGAHVLLNFAGEVPAASMFNVVASDAPAAVEPDADVHLKLLDFAFTLPTEISAGEHTWLIENAGGQWHEMVIMRVPEGMTVEAYHTAVHEMAMGGPESEPIMEQVGMWAPASAGERAWTTFNLEPGTYVISCFLPDLHSGHAHSDLGMTQVITVTEA